MQPEQSKLTPEQGRMEHQVQDLFQQPLPQAQNDPAVRLFIGSLPSEQKVTFMAMDGQAQANMFETWVNTALETPSSYWATMLRRP